MPQYIGDLLQRAAVLQEAAGQGMPQGMGSAVIQTDAPEGIPDEAVYRVGTDGRVVRR